MSIENTNFQIVSDEDHLINRNDPMTKRIYWRLIKYDLLITFTIVFIAIFGYFVILLMAPLKL